MLGLGNGLGFNRVIGVPFLLDKFSGAAAAYSLRALSSTTTDVVRVRRSSDNAEQDFSSGEITDGTLEDFVNARDVAPADYGTGAAAAYSLRYVSDSYTGDVVRVRRDSDNAEADFNPTEITDGTLLTWVGNTASDNGHVTTWYDQSGNSNDATQATASQQPKIVDSGVLVEENGKPAVEFDGTDGFISNSNIGISGNTNRSVFVVNKRVSAIIQNEILAWGNNSSAEFFNFTSEFALRISGSFNVWSDSVDISIASLIGSGTTLADYVLYKNGTALPSTSSSNLATTLNTSNTQLAIGGVPQSLGSNITLQEIIIYPSDQSSNRENIEANVNDYYSIYTNTNDGFVTTWYDQSGSNDATQATASAQPKIVDAGSLVTQGGLPAVDFDGSNTLTVNNSKTFFKHLHDGTTSTFLGVVTAGKIASPSAYYSILANNDGSSANIGLSLVYNDAGAASDALLIQSSKGVAGVNVIFSSNNNVITPNEQSLVYSIIDADNVVAANRAQSSVNGSSLFGSNSLTNAPSTAAATFDLQIGADGNTGNFLTGFMQEIIIYDSDQSSNKTNIETNINNHYSIY